MAGAEPVLDRLGRWIFAKAWLGCVFSGVYAAGGHFGWPRAVLTTAAVFAAMALAVTVAWLPGWTKQRPTGIAVADIGARVLVWTGFAAAVAGLLIGSPGVGAVAGALLLDTARRTFLPGWDPLRALRPRPMPPTRPTPARATPARRTPVRPTPGTRTRAPSTGMRAPSTGARAANIGARAASTGVRAPGTGVRAPGTGVRAASTGMRVPSTGMRAPGTGMRATDTGMRAANTGKRAADTGMSEASKGMRGARRGGAGAGVSSG